MTVGVDVRGDEAFSSMKSEFTQIATQVAQSTVNQLAVQMGFPPLSPATE